MLLLFDIDGTLLRKASLEHAQAIHGAIREVHGVDPGKPTADVAGRTDGEIARLMLAAAGVPHGHIDERRVALRDSACRLYAAACPADLSDRVVPGIPELLDWLATQPGVRLSLVTGNYEPIARLKLARAGIGRHFPAGQGGFGSDSEDRAALPAIARRRAGDHPRERTIVIGDTPRDIACARADGVHCIGVTSGPYRAAELSGADAVADDTAALRAALLDAGVGGAR